MKVRIVFILGLSIFFIGAVIATYVYGVNIPSTGISTRVLGFVIDTIEKIGYFGVFMLMVLESCGIPIPSEIIMPFSGFLVYMGMFDFWVTVLVGSLANLVGSIFAYFIGLKGRTFLDKYGKYLFIHKHHLKYAENLFYRYGSIIVLLGRNMPVVRTYISFPTGISKMNFMKFSILTFIGSIPWNIFLVYVGIILGEHWGSVVEFFEKLDTIILISLALILIYLLKFEAKSASE
ncbi:MAG: DedA family protein [Candidatus Njordarchaeota archaeon]